jgi:hypothetical protein
MEETMNNRTVRRTLLGSAFVFSFIGLTPFAYAIPMDEQAYVGKNQRDPVVLIQRDAIVDGANVDDNRVQLFEYAEADAFGNSQRWGAGYDIKFSGQAARDFWIANTKITGYANTWARVFGSSFSVATVAAEAKTVTSAKSRWAGISYSIYVFGNKLRD